MATDKSCCWSITINNPDEADKIAWAALKNYSWFRSQDGQMEKGQEGTPHFQGILHTTSIRFACIKKVLPRAHIEKAKNPKGLERYVVKEETRLGDGTFAPKTQVASQSDLQTEIYESVINRWNVMREGNPDLTLDVFLKMMVVRYPLKKGHTFADIIFDASVNSLIEKGFYGIEFVAANPQVRLAFTKYFSAIVIRTHNAQTNRRTTSSENRCSDRPQESTQPDESLDQDSEGSGEKNDRKTN